MNIRNYNIEHEIIFALAQTGYVTFEKLSSSLPPYWPTDRDIKTSIDTLMQYGIVDVRKAQIAKETYFFLTNSGITAYNTLKSKGVFDNKTKKDEPVVNPDHEALNVLIKAGFVNRISGWNDSEQFVLTENGSKVYSVLSKVRAKKFDVAE